MRIAFTAPLKGPDHPVPSGDRQMARALLAALRAGRHTVTVASPLRTFLSAPDPGRMAAVEAEAAAEVARLSAAWTTEGPPDLLFTYHSHYKAPDLLGPALSRHFALPYVAAEASHAGKRATGPWAAWHALNAAALRAADLHLCFTPRDAAGLAGLVAPERIALLPPFLAAMPPEGPARSRRGGPVRLVAVAMMRPGDKARSHAFLAEALSTLPPGLRWHLTLVGDGPARDAVVESFSTLPAERLTWAGERDPAGVAAALAAADLYVWPGFGEAYGLGYLEAAAAGLPVLAMDCGGIGSVVDHGVTGLLTPDGDLPAHAAALERLIADPGLRARLGAAGRRMVREERGLEGATARLDAALENLSIGVRRDG